MFPTSFASTFVYFAFLFTLLKAKSRSLYLIGQLFASGFLYKVVINVLNIFSFETPTKSKYVISLPLASNRIYTNEYSLPVML